MVLSNLKNFFKRINVKSWYKKYENHISSLALVLGFTIDSLTLSTVDQLIDQTILTIYITLAGLCIILISVYDNKILKEKVEGRARFWFTFVMQFALGGLLSAYVVFYSKGSTLESSWPFLLLLVIYFLGNEIFKKHYRELSFRLSIYFFALLSYFIIIVPTIFESIDRWVFIVSSFVAVIVFTLFIWIISLFTSESVQQNKRMIIIYSTAILLIINIFYFLNIIPPLPLLLKDSGVYHSLILKSDGGYIVSIEDSNKLKDFFGSKKVFHRYNFEPVYVMTAVYSPTNLDVTIIHNWQRFDPMSKRWVTESNITVPIRGGRQDGYRLYSVKNSVTEGLWRVNVLTDDRRIIGRVKFEIENTDYSYILETIHK